MGLQKTIAYARKVLPGAVLAALAAPVREPVHLMIAVADHFEPAIDPEDGQKRVPLPPASMTGRKSIVFGIELPSYPTRTTFAQ